jgi:hypothetical protein
MPRRLRNATLRALVTVAGTAFLAQAPTSAAEAPAIESIEVVGTEFRLTTSDDRVLSSRDFIGFPLTVDDGSAAGMTVRIDAVEPDPRDPAGDVLLHTFSVRNSLTGEWDLLCPPDEEGLTIGFPLARLEGEPDGFDIACTTGARAQCIRFGYKPWGALPDGTSLLDHFKACVRLLRADYCGTGFSATRDGTPVEQYDRVGIQADDSPPGMSFEAAWGPDGAVCVRRVRVPEKASLERLAPISCPRLKPEVLGEACSEETAPSFGRVLLFNKSF